MDSGEDGALELPHIFDHMDTLWGLSRVLGTGGDTADGEGSARTSAWAAGDDKSAGLGPGGGGEFKASFVSFLMGVSEQRKVVRDELGDSHRLLELFGAFGTIELSLQKWLPNVKSGYDT